MKQKVLVIDDEKGIALALKMTLKAAGYDVITAEDGVMGMEFALNDNPDIILLDLVLPKLNGFLVLEGLKENTVTSKIPVIVQSAKAQEEDIQKARLLGASEYLVKPFRSSELLQTIKTHLPEKECV